MKRDLKRLASVLWMAIGIPALGLLSYELEPMDSTLFAAVFLWIAGLIPSISSIFSQTASGSVETGR